jgi:metal-responsive CopG/Arc/MetJ family transcriptional regulator
MTSGGKRPGSGAPKKPEPEKRTKTSVQIKTWMLKIVDDMARTSGVSRSRVIEAAIQLLVDDKPKAPGNF